MFTGTLYDIICPGGKIYVYRDIVQCYVSKWEDVCLQGTLYDILCRSGKIYVYRDTVQHSMSKWEDVCLQGHCTTFYVEVRRYMFASTSEKMYPNT